MQLEREGVARGTQNLMKITFLPPTLPQWNGGLQEQLYRKLYRKRYVMFSAYLNMSPKICVHYTRAEWPTDLNHIIWPWDMGGWVKVEVTWQRFSLSEDRYSEDRSPWEGILSRTHLPLFVFSTVHVQLPILFPPVNTPSTSNFLLECYLPSKTQNIRPTPRLSWSWSHGHFFPISSGTHHVYLGDI